MDLMTTAEVADLLRVAPGTLRAWRHASEGPASFKLTGRVVYRRDAVERWIAAQEAATASTTPAA